MVPRISKQNIKQNSCQITAHSRTFPVSHSIPFSLASAAAQQVQRGSVVVLYLRGRTDAEGFRLFSESVCFRVSFQGVADLL